MYDWMSWNEDKTKIPMKFVFHSDICQNINFQQLDYGVDKIHLHAASIHFESSKICACIPSMKPHQKDENLQIQTWILNWAKYEIKFDLGQTQTNWFNKHLIMTLLPLWCYIKCDVVWALRMVICFCGI